jgi:hypothetical protein
MVAGLSANKADGNRYGNDLVSTYQTTERPVENVLGEEVVLRELELVWEKTQAQLNIISSLWDNLHEDLRDRLGESLQDLKERLTFGYRGTLDLLTN